MSVRTRPGATSPHARAGWALALMLTPVVLALVVLPAVPGGRTGALSTAVGLAGMWVTASLALWVARMPESLHLGLTRPRRADVLLGIGAGIVLMLAVPALSLLGAQLMPSDGGNPMAARTHWSVVLLAVITAAVTEEVVYRGNGITALQTTGAPTWAAASISLALFTLLHGGGWPIAHVLFVVLPLGIALTLLFLWRRNLWVVMIAHFLVDLPLVLLAV